MSRCRLVMGSTPLAFRTGGGEGVLKKIRVLVGKRVYADRARDNGRGHAPCDSGIHETTVTDRQV